MARRGSHGPTPSGPGPGQPYVATSSRSLELGRELLVALGLLEGREISAVLDRSLMALGLHRTVDEVMLPSMREAGTRWSRGRCDSEEERLASTTLRSWLVQRAQAAPPPRHEPAVVLACGPMDRHTIALETFDVLLSHAGFDCLNLGPQVQPAALTATVSATSAQAVVLVSHLAENRAAAVSALRAVGRSSATLFYAGSAFRTRASRQSLPGHYLGGNLSDAAAHVSWILTGGGSPQGA